MLDEEAPSGYIAGGKLHRLQGGTLRAEDNAQAQPYLWPIAHDVRPATQALGAKGCQDCHSTDAAIFFGKVAVDSPLASDRTASLTMAHFEKGLDVDYQSKLAGTWKYRGWLKAIGLTAAGLLLLVLLAYVVRAVDRPVRGHCGEGAVSYPSEGQHGPDRGSGHRSLDLVARLILRRNLPERKLRPAGPVLFRALRIAVNIAGAVALFLVSWTSMSRLMSDEPTLTGGPASSGMSRWRRFSRSRRLWWRCSGRAAIASSRAIGGEAGLCLCVRSFSGSRCCWPFPPSAPSSPPCFPSPIPKARRI